MSIVKHTLVYPVFETETKPIHTEHLLEIPYQWGCNSDFKDLSFTWDPTKTKINSVKLRARVYSEHGYRYFDYFMNNQKVLSLGWDISSGWKEGETDVTALIYNGTNYFKAQACKSLPDPRWSKFWIWGELIIDYTGIPPEVPEPTTPDGWRTLAEWMPWIVGGCLALGGVYIVFAYVAPEVRQSLAEIRKAWLPLP